MFLASFASAKCEYVQGPGAVELQKALRESGKIGRPWSKVGGLPGSKLEHRVLLEDVDGFAKAISYRCHPYYVLGVEKLPYDSLDKKVKLDSLGQEERRHVTKQLRRGAKRMLLTHGAYLTSDPPKLLFDGRSPGSGRDLWESGYEALTEGDLFTDLAEKIQGASHVFVLVTGWNNAQAKAIDKHLQWMEAIDRSFAKDTTFSPVYVGLTWQSNWSCGPFLDEICMGWRVVSGPIKGNDSEEVGILWGDLLLRAIAKGSRDAAQKPSIVLVGHSFGTRVLAEAVFREGLFDYSSKPEVDAFVAFQSAISRNSFQGTGTVKSPPYTIGSGTGKSPSPRVSRSVFTCSSKDYVLRLLRVFMGRCKASEELQDFSRRTLTASGELNLPAGKGAWVVIGSAHISGHGDVFGSKTDQWFAEVLQSSPD